MVTRLTLFNSQKMLKTRARNIHLTNVAKNSTATLQNLNNGKKASTRFSGGQTMTTWQEVAAKWQKRGSRYNNKLTPQQLELRAISMEGLGSRAQEAFSKPMFSVYE